MGTVFLFGFFFGKVMWNQCICFALALRLLLLFMYLFIYGSVVKGIQRKIRLEIRHRKIQWFCGIYVERRFSNAKDVTWLNKS